MVVLFGNLGTRAGTKLHDQNLENWNPEGHRYLPQQILNFEDPLIVCNMRDVSTRAISASDFFQTKHELN
jgi:hypothetical protein